MPLNVIAPVTMACSDTFGRYDYGAEFRKNAVCSASNKTYFSIECRI